LVNLSDKKGKETDSSTFIITVPETGVMVCGPGAHGQGTVRPGKFVSHSMIWQSGNKQAERQDVGIALSHRKQKVKPHVVVHLILYFADTWRGSPHFSFLPILDMHSHGSPHSSSGTH